MSTVNPIFFPTQVILVDDDESILEGLSNQLSLLNRPFKAFSSPFEALDYLEMLGQKSLSEKLMIQDDETTLNANLKDLYKEIYNQSRYQTISTIIADFDMPDMNGLEFLSKIKIPNVQKILLTGVADENLAISAFNDGVINYYIKKHDPKIYPIIEACLAQSQDNFFSRETRVFLQAIKHEGYSQAIMQTDFEDFFKGILKQEDISEYYLLDSFGTFLMIDNNNNLSNLFVFDESILKYQFYAVDGDLRKSDLSEADFDAIEKHKKAICYISYEEGDELKADSLSKYLHDLKEIKLGKRTYYYAFVKGVPNLTWPPRL